jgi:hypothetical protein
MGAQGNIVLWRRRYLKTFSNYCIADDGIVGCIGEGMIQAGPDELIIILRRLFKAAGTYDYERVKNSST